MRGDGLASITLSQQALVHKGPMLTEPAMLGRRTVALQTLASYDDEIAAHRISRTRHHEEDCTIGATPPLAYDGDTASVSALKSTLEPVLLHWVHRHTLALSPVLTSYYFTTHIDLPLTF